MCHFTQPPHDEDIGPIRGPCRRARRAGPRSRDLQRRPRRGPHHDSEESNRHVVVKRLHFAQLTRAGRRTRRVRATSSYRLERPALRRRRLRQVPAKPSKHPMCVRAKKKVPTDSAAETPKGLSEGFGTWLRFLVDGIDVLIPGASLACLATTARCRPDSPHHIVGPRGAAGRGRSVAPGLLDHPLPLPGVASVSTGDPEQLLASGNRFLPSRRISTTNIERIESLVGG